jgi:hypothetical protein
MEVIMIHIITYQSIKGNDEQQIFEDFASALKLITNLQQNDYPFSYNSVNQELALSTIPDFMEGYPQYRKRDASVRQRALAARSLEAFVATNNQTRQSRCNNYDTSVSEINIKRLDTGEAIEALELEQKISA